MRGFVVWGLVLGVVFGPMTVALAPAAVPLQWAQKLNAACRWDQRAWVKAIDSDIGAPWNKARRRAEWHCLHERGQMSPSPLLNHLQANWPTAAELAASRQENPEDADDLPLPAPPSIAPDPASHN